MVRLPPGRARRQVDAEADQEACGSLDVADHDVDLVDPSCTHRYHRSPVPYRRLSASGVGWFSHEQEDQP